MDKIVNTQIKYYRCKAGKHGGCFAVSPSCNYYFGFHPAEYFLYLCKLVN